VKLCQNKLLTENPHKILELKSSAFSDEEILENCNKAISKKIIISSREQYQSSHSISTSVKFLCSLSNVRRLSLMV